MLIYPKRSMARSRAENARNHFLMHIKVRTDRAWHTHGEVVLSMSTTELPPRSDITIGELVVAQPALARVFEKLGFDYCCGGKQTLAAVCARRGLDLATVTAMLDGTTLALNSAAPEVDAASLSLGALADHIEQTHHAYLKTELPRLTEKSERVARKHGWRDPRLREVRQTVRTFAEEMFGHMQKEEGILFPLVRQIEAGAGDAFHCGSIANPIHVMEAEHESAGAAIARLRELTNGFTPTDQDCNTHRALLGGLADLEADLHRHVHKENNILFPRALARASRNCAPTTSITP
jgi:regulator of cell morphogenesis and NO signaling